MIRICKSNETSQIRNVSEREPPGFQFNTKISGDTEVEKSTKKRRNGFN